jgi:hypothetical protein
MFFRVSFGQCPERTFMITPFCPQHSDSPVAPVSYGRDILECSPDVLSLIYRLRAPTRRRATSAALSGVYLAGDVVVRVAGLVPGDGGGAAGGRQDPTVILDVELLHCTDVLVDPRVFEFLFSVLVPHAHAMVVTEASSSFSPALHPEAPHALAALAAAGAATDAASHAAVSASVSGARNAVIHALAAPALAALTGLRLPLGLPGAAAPVGPAAAAVAAASVAASAAATPLGLSASSAAAAAAGAAGALAPGAALGALPTQATGLNDGLTDWAEVAATQLGSELKPHRIGGLDGGDNGDSAAVSAVAVPAAAAGVVTIAGPGSGAPTTAASRIAAGPRGATAASMGTGAGVGAGPGAGSSVSSAASAAAALLRVVRVSPSGFAFGAWGLGQEYSPAHAALQYVQLLLH